MDVGDTGNPTATAGTHKGEQPPQFVRDPKVLMCVNEGESAHDEESKNNEEHQFPPEDQPLTKDVTSSSECTPNSSPQKKNPSQQEKSFYPGSPVALHAPDFQQGERGQYDYQEHNEYHHGNASEFAAANIQGESPTTRQNNENGMEEPSEEGLLFEESSYGDEIAKWMEDQNSQSSLQQQIFNNGQVQQKGTGGDDSSVVRTGPAPEELVNGIGNEINANESGNSSDTPSKRPASEMSNSSTSQQLSTKRRQRPQSTSLFTSLDQRKPTRKRMDYALHERTASQMGLREALLALEKAKAVVSECRSRYDAAKNLVECTAKVECEALLEEETPWNDMFHKLKQHKIENGDCNVKQNNKNSPELVRRLSAWVGKNRKDGKQKKRGASMCASGTCKASTEIQAGNAFEESDVEQADQTSMAVVPDESRGDILHTEDQDDSSVFDDVDPDSINADPYKSIALDSIGFDWDPRNSRWNNMYEELRCYKDEHGNTLVPHANFGLGAWVKRQQVQYTLYCKGDGTKSDLTDDRVRLLNDLGFIWSRRTNTWNENFLRLSKWKETHGSCHIPDDSKDPELATLNKWVADQRVHHKRQIAEDEGNCSDDPNKPDKKDCDEKASGSDGAATKKKSKRKHPKLSHDQIEKLKGIGFEFDSRDAKWLQKLDVLLKYKQTQGDFLVPSSYPDDPTLSNWVASQRAQYKLYTKGSKSHMTDRRLKILTDAGFPFSVKKVKKEAAKEAAHDFGAKPWLEKYKDFLLFIATHGSLESLHKSKSFLAEWAAKQREEYPSLGGATAVQDREEIQSNVESIERAALMDAAHFFVYSQNIKANTLPPDKNNVEPSSVIKEESSWDDQFGNLAAWYIKHGSYGTTSLATLQRGTSNMDHFYKVIPPKGMPSKMKKFLSRQLEQHRLFTSGAVSELTSERIEKLEDIRFPFDKPAAKEPREDDTVAPKRNRSWEEYRLDLAIAYIQKGTYDASSLDDVELRRWATEQKRQHKLYLAGKQTSLTFPQIQKLMDIKFIAKRPKQKSWTENCADLMAFRIQFGTFDVSSAHVVTISKGRSANPCTSNSTALKNLQEWVVKLREHYSDASKSVEVNDELTQDQLLKLVSVGFPWSGPCASRGELLKVSCSLKQQEKTDVPAEISTSIAPIRSNLFGMTLEIMHQAVS